MSVFKDREKGHENKYARDEEIEFRVAARTNKLLGYWAAELLGKIGDEADAYVKEVIKSDFEEAGNEDVYRKLAGDLGDRVDEATIRAKMAECAVEARRQLETE